MKQFFWGLILVTLFTSGYSDELPPKPVNEGYSSQCGTALSMVGWGISLVIGIATLVCLIPSHTSSNP